MHEDLAYKWLKSICPDTKLIHTPQQRIDFICKHFGVVNDGYSKTVSKRILKSISSLIDSGQEVTLESFIVRAIASYEAKAKWDLDKIAFCRSKKFYSSQKWKNLRLKALAISNHCKACGRSPDSGAVLHVDHILPRSIYPEHALRLGNLQILCAECNLGKGNTIFKRF